MSAAVIETVKIGGKAYRLTFKTGTMRLAEQQLGQEITGNLGSISGLSALFWAVLQPAHRMTQEATDDLIDEAGGIAEVGQILARGMRLYQGVDPDAPDDAEGADDPAGEPAAPAKKK